MNVERIREIADHIEKYPNHFDQSDWGNSDLGDMLVRLKKGEIEKIEPYCSTVGCVSGWACALYGPDAETRCYSPSSAKYHLDLTEYESNMLFKDHWPIEWTTRMDLEIYCSNNYWVPTPEEAVTVLRYIGKNGRFPE